MKANLYFVLFISFIVTNIFTTNSYASSIIEFGPQDTKLNGLIKYTVIGKYKSEFEEFNGKIKINEESKEIESVYLQIKTSTIKSSCSWCDTIVRSKQLLDVEKYPDIIFQSSEILKDTQGYQVKGLLSMHGVQKEIIFPFDVDIVKKNNNARFDIKGEWLINRKEFNIIWNKLLDKGGVLVGNTITVDWGISSTITNL